LLRVNLTKAHSGEILKIYGSKLNLTPINNAEAIAVHGDKFEILGH
jgi:peptidase family S51